MGKCPFSLLISSHNWCTLRVIFWQKRINQVKVNTVYINHRKNNLCSIGKLRLQVIVFKYMLTEYTVYVTNIQCTAPLGSSSPYTTIAFLYDSHIILNCPLPKNSSTSTTNEIHIPYSQISFEASKHKYQVFVQTWWSKYSVRNFYQLKEYLLVQKHKLVDSG